VFGAKAIFGERRSMVYRYRKEKREEPSRGRLINNLFIAREDANDTRIFAYFRRVGEAGNVWNADRRISRKRKTRLLLADETRCRSCDRHFNSISIAGSQFSICSALDFRHDALFPPFYHLAVRVGLPDDFIGTETELIGVDCCATPAGKCRTNRVSRSKSLELISCHFRTCSCSWESKDCVQERRARGF